MATGLNKAPAGKYWNYSCNIFPYCSGKAFGDHPCPVFERGACFAFNIYKRYGIDRQHPAWKFERLKGLKKIPPSIIFLNLMGDMFDQVSVNSPHFHQHILNATCFSAITPDKHQYLIATKQPQNIPQDITFPDNIWLGVSICNQWMFDELIKLLKARDGRLFKGGHFFFSLEPLYEQINILDDDVETLKKAGLEWATIGGQTNPIVYPNPDWIEEICLQIYGTDDDFPIWIKNNAWNPLDFAWETGDPDIEKEHTKEDYQQLPPALKKVRGER